MILILAQRSGLPAITENENHSQQRSGLGSIARKLPRCGPDRMGGHRVRLGAVTVPAFRADRIVKSCDSFGLGLARCGLSAHIGCKQRALSQPPPLPPIRDLLSSCLAAAAFAGCGAAD
jgi:hypothetical protein